MSGEPAQVDDRSTVLDIPIGVPTHRRPYWHRNEPLVAATRVDPDFTRLKRYFPDAWAHLARTKAIIDGVAALEAPATIPATMHLNHISPLLMAAALELNQFAATQQACGRELISTQARTSAERLRTYAQVGEWKQVELSPPPPDQPWLYCGPLSTWAMHTNHSGLGFLVLAPRADIQPVPDAVDAQRDAIQSLVIDILGGPVRTVRPVWPTMQINDLLLAGGESAFGHKNFAHFFPLEAANSTILDAEFTTVFANIHSQRLRRCSLPLLDRYQGASAPADGAAILRASLTWFRCHDTAHFWRRVTPGGNEAPSGLSPFEAMALEETYADTLGLLSAAVVSPDTRILGRAFLAELFRYLSRHVHHFADSTAAALTIGWLHDRAVFPESGDDAWLDKSRAPLEELICTIHRVLWEGGDRDSTEDLRTALRGGLSFRDRVASLYEQIPTDLEYIFG